jgi:hypothetical protein
LFKILYTAKFIVYDLLVSGLLFTLVFFAAAFATLCALGRAIYLLIRGRARDAGRVLFRLSVGAAVYLAAVLVVSLLTPQRRLAIGQKRCFDEWCYTVTAADWRGEQVAVDLHITSEARRVSMRELGVGVRLLDSNGHSYWPVSESGPPLDTMLGPGESFDTRRIFRVPQDAVDVGLEVAHGITPALVIIADPGSLLHRPTLIMLRSGVSSRNVRHTRPNS